MTMMAGVEIERPYANCLAPRGSHLKHPQPPLKSQVESELVDVRAELKEVSGHWRYDHGWLNNESTRLWSQSGYVREDKCEM